MTPPNLPSLSAFACLPPNILTTPTPFTLSVPSKEVNLLPRLARTGTFGVPSYYNTEADAASGKFGITRDWLINATSIWTSPSQFSWRSHEQYMNHFPNFRVNVTTPSDNELYDLHFAALFSKNESAIPIIFMHGWPGSWTEFAPMMDLLVDKYPTPEELPYHVVVPSIPDYGLSTRPGEVHKEINMTTAGEAMNQLMIELGFGESGYIAQGGDVGYFLARTMCGLFEECRAFHINMFFLTEEERAAVNDISITPEEATQVELGDKWGLQGSAYAAEHGTRPATIALALMSSPVAMLAWMGEKFIEWSDNRDPSYALSLDTILAQVSFYWYTESYGRSMWVYRALKSEVPSPLPPMPWSSTKPFGFSWFPVEIASLPQAWGDYLFENMVFHRRHARGGHFAALQEPAEFLQDIEDFVAIVKQNVTFSS
ncbi:putative epoxide hydrolase [Rhypophila decipiens]